MKKKAKRARARRRNPVAKAVRKIAPKVKPAKRRRPPETKEWDDVGR
jgi:hypothetical protein